MCDDTGNPQRIVREPLRAFVSHPHEVKLDIAAEVATVTAQPKPMLLPYPSRTLVLLVPLEALIGLTTV